MDVRKHTRSVLSPDPDAVEVRKRDAESWSARPIQVTGAEIRISPAQGGSRGGILAAHLRLRRDAGNSVQRIGSTTLSLDGRSAVWRFQ